MGNKNKLIVDFTDLEAWQKAHELVLGIYNITDKYPRSELFGLVSQVRRAAMSISANIAEGFSRYHYKDKVRFYYNARASASEVINFLILSFDLSYLDENVCLKLKNDANNVRMLINGLVRAIEKRL